MSRKHVLLVLVLSLVSVCSTNAQESIRLRFKVVRNGSVLANPEMSVNQGSAGRIEIKDIVSLVFTPTVSDSRLSLAFDIKTGDRHLKPQLVIDKLEPGAISWTSASGELIRITVVAIR
jgi:hypothetical protein